MTPISPALVSIRILLAALVTLAASTPASATEWFVAVGGSGAGTSANPLGRVQDALELAQPGDIVTVERGTYAEALHTVRGGREGAPILIRAANGPRSAIMTARGRVATIAHPFVIVDGLVLDGQYGTDDTLRVATGGSNVIIRNCEVRHSSRDLIDMSSPHDVLIDGCLIHHALDATNGRTDAHGIVAGAVRDLTIRNTEIHTFSGDGIQLDPARAAPGWDRVTVEHTHIWLAPLPSAENGFAAGTVTGENAIDTKANSRLSRATLVVRDIVASGFRNGLITNMAAFNLKENIDATIDGATVYDSEIAFRLRGPNAGAPAGAWVTIRNAVVYSVKTAFRYEDHIEQVRIWNSTVGARVMQAFQAAAATSRGVEVANLLMLGLHAAEADGRSNMTAGAAAFVDAGRNDYHLAPGSPAIDAGVWLMDVTTDRDGVPRPQGRAPDVGAYERR